MTAMSKNEELTKCWIHFTAAEDFCLEGKKIRISRKMNEKHRQLPYIQLKFQTSIFFIIDYYRTYMADSRPRWPVHDSSLDCGLPSREPLGEDYDLTVAEDLYRLSCYFPHEHHHRFMLALDLVDGGAFVGE